MYTIFIILLSVLIGVSNAGGKYNSDHLNNKPTRFNIFA